MGYSRIVFWCNECRANTHHYRPEINHTVHLLGALLTLGFWALVWVGLCLFREPWTCEECGHEAAHITHVRPDLRKRDRPLR